MAGWIFWLLGPIAGIMITDYFLLRGTKLSVPSLYQRDGLYEYRNGINPHALIALAAGVLVALCGLIVPPLRWLYDYSWFVGCGIAGTVYYVSTRMRVTQSKLVGD